METHVHQLLTFNLLYMREYNQTDKLLFRISNESIVFGRQNCHYIQFLFDEECSFKQNA